MPYYQYIIVNQQSRKLTGTISANNEKKAREELNNLGFSIVSLSEISKEEYDKQRANKQKFQFEAYDRHGKKVVGTIPAADKYQAFKKLNLEYMFTVNALCLEGISPANRQTEIAQGLEQLKQQLEEEKKITAEKSSEVTPAGKDQNSEAPTSRQLAAMQEKVRLIMEKIKVMLSEYEHQLDPEKLKNIKNLFNKLIRIKSSTNVNYVEQTCEELLKAIQDEELFIKDSAVNKEKQKINLETKKMLLELHKKPGTGLQAGGFLESLKKFANEGKDAQGFKKYFAPFIQNIIKALKVPEELQDLHQQKKIVTGQIFTYIKLWFRAKKDEKQEIMKSLKVLFKERKNLSQQISGWKKQNRSTLDSGTNFLTSIYQEISIFSGWLLVFYLSLYFLANYSKTKALNFLPSYFLQFYEIPLLRNVILILFTAHVCVSTKLNYFPRSLIASIMVIPVALFLSLFLINNF